MQKFLDSFGIMTVIGFMTGTQLCALLQTLIDTGAIPACLPTMAPQPCTRDAFLEGHIFNPEDVIASLFEKTFSELMEKSDTHWKASRNTGSEDSRLRVRYPA